MLLISLSNVGVVDLEVCCPIFGIFHFAPRYFNIIDRSKLSVGRVPNCCFLKRGQSLLQFFSLIISVFCYCNKVGSLKLISVLLTYLSNFRLFTKILFLRVFSRLFLRNVGWLVTFYYRLDFCHMLVPSIKNSASP